MIRPDGLSAPKAFPPPLRGWVDADSPMMVKPLGASVLENWLPTQQSLRLRGGCQMVSTLPAAATALFAYDNGAVQKLLGATADGAFDASVLDGSAATAMAPPGGSWQTVQFRTAGKTYLYAVNGVSSPWLFDGTTWQAVGGASTPISITGATTAGLASVWAFKSRLFFARAGGMEVIYLPVGQVGGAAADLNLSGVFQRGGRILFGTTWSSDSGAGLDDRCVIVTDMGEVAVFEGDDPLDINRWRIAGRYEIAPPLGRDAWCRVGGDVLIATTDGLLPLSGAAGKDSLALASIAVSRPITNAWQRSVADGATGWRVVRWERAGIVLVIRPTEPGVTWGVNAETGAWFKIVGWDMQHATMHKGRLYFAGRGGVVRQGDTTGQDDGAAIVARYRGLAEVAPVGLKVVQLARASFRSNTDAHYSLRFVASERDDWPTLPEPWQPADLSGLWDRGLWDQMTWDSAGEEVVTIDGYWEAVGASGQKIAPEVQVVSDDQLPSVCEYLGCEAMIEVGGLVV